MPSKKLLITASVLVVAVGATAAVAQGYRDHQDGWSGERGFMGWRHRGWSGWRDTIKKSEFDERTRTRFAQIDTNSDKVVDADEAKAMITARVERRAKGWRRERQQRRLERLLKRFDLNHDKKIERAEFDREIGFIFARMDLDGDGKLTDQDLPPMLRGRDILKGNHFGRPMMRKGGIGRFLARLRGADANNDGEITRAEADAAAGKFFARYDHNKDGIVEMADFEALKHETIAYRVKRFFHRYGGSKDGKLTLEQYTAERDRWFARWDANGDKVLTGDELPRNFKRFWRRHAWNDDRGHDGWHRDRMRDHGPRWNDDERSDDQSDSRSEPPRHERRL